MKPHSTLALLGERPFQLFAASRFCQGVSFTLLQAILAWQVYAISGDPAALAFLGLARFVPSLAMSLVGGAAADSWDRKNIILVSQFLPLAGGVTLALLTAAETVALPHIFLFVMVLGVVSSFENPARQAMLPQIVPRESFQKAVTFLTTIQQLAMALGPTIAGFAIKLLDIHGAYWVQSALILGSIVSMVLVQPQFERGRVSKLSIALIKEGLQFVRGQRILLGAMLLDMFAVIFGGASALLPIYAQDILKVGPEGYGLLSSAQNVGASASALLLLLFPPIRKTGRALLLAVSGFGFLTILFGLSTSLPLSLVLYGLTGMSDQVSVVLRQTMIQMSTPDELRGRVSSVNQVFIGASNHLGMVESGLVAAVTTATFAVVSGGVACLATIGIVAWRIPEMMNYELDHRPVRATNAEPAPAKAR